MSRFLLLAASLTFAAAERLPAIFERVGSDLRANRITESADGFDKLARLVPDYAPQLWQGGIALYHGGRYEDRNARFEPYCTENPKNAGNAAWQFLCVALPKWPNKPTLGCCPLDRIRPFP